MKHFLILLLTTMLITSCSKSDDFGSNKNTYLAKQFTITKVLLKKSNDGTNDFANATDVSENFENAWVEFMRKTGAFAYPKGSLETNDLSWYELYMPTSKKASGNRHYLRNETKEVWLENVYYNKTLQTISFNFQIDDNIYYYFGELVKPIN